MNKIGDIITAYGNPVKEQLPIGKCRLVRKLGEYAQMEEWMVEFLDEEGLYRNLMIHKSDNNGKN